VIREIDEMLVRLSFEEREGKLQKALMRKIARRRLGMPDLPLQLLLRQF